MNEELKFISLAEAAKITNYSQDYISLLCRQGKMKAQKLGRNWVTTEGWVREYINDSDGCDSNKNPIKFEREKLERVAEVLSGAVLKLDSKSFYGKPTLEFALFCFFSIMIFCNFYSFVYQTEEMKYEKIFEGKAARADFSGSVAGVKSERDLQIKPNSASQSFELIEITGLSELSEDILKSRIQEGFTEEVDVEIFDGFAIVSYKNNPEKRFVYIER